MNPGPPLLRAASGLVDRVLCVAGATAFAQAPEFIQQYLQRLGGHLDEARRIVEQYRRTAVDAGLSLPQFIQHTAGNADPAVARLAPVMSAAKERADSLQSAFDALTQAEPWARPAAFLGHLDLSIARATWSGFKPAIPTTAEGLAYALAGMVVLLGLYHLAVRPACARAFRRTPKTAPAH